MSDQALSGFPFFRNNIRENFPRVLEETNWKSYSANCNLLCFHQCVEGSKVGPGNFTFRNQRDVVKISDIPGDFAAVLSGHIHRFQVLTKDLRGKSIPTSIFYPGSIERTSFAEGMKTKVF